MACNFFIEVVHIAAHRVDTRFKERHLVLNILRRSLRDLAKISVGKNHNGATNGDTRRSRDTRKNGVFGFLARRTQPLNRPCCFGMRNNARKLSRQCDEKRLFALVETATLALLNNQNTEHRAVVNDGHSKERIKFFLAGILKVEVAGVFRCITQIDRLGILCNKTHQTFIGLQANAANGLCL